MNIRYQKFKHKYTNTVAVLGLSVGGSGVAMVLGGGIEPERLQVSYHELQAYYHRVLEIRRQNNHRPTAQTVNRSKLNENTQNMHAREHQVLAMPAS